MQIIINSSGNKTDPEVEMLADSKNYKLLSSGFQEAQSEIKLILSTEESPFYPISLLYLVIKPLEESSGLLMLRLEEELMEIAGDRKAFANFGETLLNLSKSRIGQHFHIDYYDGNGIVDITNISMTVSLKI